VGHFYSSMIADIIYRFHKISGFESRFTTGIDENSQKAVLKAQEEWKDILDYLDDMASGHKAVWDHFNMSYTDFIRTTEARHHSLVQEVLQYCFDKGDIYQGEYEGMYCVGCESFKKDDDLVFLNKTSGETFPITPKVTPSDNIIKVCPDHLKTPDYIKEKNYFFKLSKYQSWMQEFYDANPDFVIPSHRFNEVKSFVVWGLEDFSISRETNTFGIPLPFDNSQVTYVWFDALFNYYTSVKYSPVKSHLNSSPQGEDETVASLSPKEREFKSEVTGEEYWNQFTDESDFWPANLHIVWKDIIRFHAVFWPAMLASYFDLWEQGSDGIIHFKDSDKEKLPKNILTGGYFTVDGQKMSKSLWNVIEPVEYSKQYSQELLTLYMLSAFPIWNDGDYDRQDAIKTYNAKLANNLWNLLNRVVVLSLRLSENTWKLSSTQDSIGEVGKLNIKTTQLFSQYNLKWVLDVCFVALDKLNKFADDTQPWITIKDDEETTRQNLYVLAEWLRQVGLCLYAFFPEKMSEMFEKLGLEWYSSKLEAWELQEILDKKEIFNIKEKGNPLFQRIEIK